MIYFHARLQHIHSHGKDCTLGFVLIEYYLILWYQQLLVIHLSKATCSGISISCRNVYYSNNGCHIAAWSSPFNNNYLNSFAWGHENSSGMGEKGTLILLSASLVLLLHSVHIPLVDLD